MTKHNKFYCKSSLVKSQAFMKNEIQMIIETFFPMQHWQNELILIKMRNQEKSASRARLYFKMKKMDISQNQKWSKKCKINKSDNKHKTFLKFEFHWKLGNLWLTLSKIKSQCKKRTDQTLDTTELVVIYLTFLPFVETVMTLMKLTHFVLAFTLKTATVLNVIP